MRAVLPENAMKTPLGSVARNMPVLKQRHMHRNRFLKRPSFPATAYGSSVRAAHSNGLLFLPGSGGGAFQIWQVPCRINYCGNDGERQEYEFSGGKHAEREQCETLIFFALHGQRLSSKVEVCGGNDREAEGCAYFANHAGFYICSVFKCGGAHKRYPQIPDYGNDVQKEEDYRVRQILVDESHKSSGRQGDAVEDFVHERICQSAESACYIPFTCVFAVEEVRKRGGAHEQNCRRDDNRGRIKYVDDGCRASCDNKRGPCECECKYDDEVRFAEGVRLLIVHLCGILCFRAVPYTESAPASA